MKKDKSYQILMIAADVVLLTMMLIAFLRGELNASVVASLLFLHIIMQSEIESGEMKSQLACMQMEIYRLRKDTGRMQNQSQAGWSISDLTPRR